MISLIHKFDEFILLYIKNNIYGITVIDKSMIFITSLGNMGFIWIVISMLLLSNKKYRKVGIMTLAALILSSILGEGILKHLVHRMRPFYNMPTMNLLISKPLSYSFPSGHTASSFAAAGILSKHLKNYNFVFFTMAFLISFSRLYLGVHYPTDVLGGIILGLICSKIITHIFNKLDYYR